LSRAVNLSKRIELSLEIDVPQFLMTDNKWARLLAYVTGLINQKLLLQNEYLTAENRILRAHLPARLRLSNPQRSTLGEIGKRLGRSALQQVAWGAKPDTILARATTSDRRRPHPRRSERIATSRFCRSVSAVVPTRSCSPSAGLSQLPTRRPSCGTPFTPPDARDQLRA
jgi:hypothetical protein